MMMEGGKGGEDDMGEGSMLCSDHPYRNSNPGGICAFCLQEKLGKLVSSSFPVAIFPSSSSSSSSFRSELGGVGGRGNGTSSTSLSLSFSAHNTSSSSSSHNNNNNSNDCHYHHYYSRRARIPFLLTQKKKKKKEMVVASSSSDHNSIILKRSKSTTTPRRRHFLDANDGDEFSPQKKGFWSFLYLTKSSTAGRRIDKNIREMSKTTSALTATPASTSASFSQKAKAKGKDLASSPFPKKGDFVVDEESPNGGHASAAASSSFDRKVSRSRSVGCGSRSFSGDFFERISTGFGDCTLRRVESQREGKPKVATAVRSHGDHHCIKERVKCGGIFGGFIMNSSSSSSSSSSYWVSSSADDMNGKTTATAAAGPLAHCRSKSLGWAFASPIRAFSKPSSNKDGKSNKNPTPNLAAIPSLLAVRG